MFDNSGISWGSATESPPEAFRDLGTYELWLSNHIGVETNLEPVAGQRTTCPDGTTNALSCPDDDDHLYLDYAAYGLFLYTPNAETFRTNNVRDDAGQVGRQHTMHFGYEAFADLSGKMTTDISKPITSGKFEGQTIAMAMKGNPFGGSNSPVETKLLRGNVVLTVNIPSSGAGSASGTINGFEEWTGNYWQEYKDGDSAIAILLHGRTGPNDSAARRSSTAAIGSDGAILSTSGGATMQIGDNFVGAGALKNVLIDSSGADTSIASNYNGTGFWEGKFYGPRTDTGLEFAGSWYHGFTRLSSRWDLVGSFGAKQRPTADSN